MKNLIYKELSLVVTPLTYMFALLSALLLIPSYPYALSTSYCMFGLLTTFNIARANNDHVFTATLPVPRKYVVYAKYVLAIFSEMLQLLVSVPFAILTAFVLNKGGNPVGMDANLAFFGIAFAAYGIFNAILLPMYFKSGYKLGMPVIVSTTVYVLFVVIVEIVIALVPVLHAQIDGLSPEFLPVRIGVLVGGIIIYVLCNVLSAKSAVKNFKRVNI